MVHNAYKNSARNKVKNKKRLLFAGEGVTMAHILRPLTLAKNYLKDYDVFFASDIRFKELIESHGVKHVSLSTIDSNLFLNRLYKGKAAYHYEELRQYILDEISLLFEISPDIVIGDFRFTFNVSCELAGIPYICLSNAQWSPGVDLPTPLPEHPLTKYLGRGVLKQFFSLTKNYFFKQHAKPMDRLRKSFNLPSLKNILDVYTAGTKTLFMDLPDLFDLKELPKDQKCIGPVHWDSGSKLPIWWSEIDKSKPIIFITPGSSGNLNAIKQALFLLSKKDITIIVATAGRFSVDFEAKNIFVDRFIDGKEIALLADVVICNGGSGMVYQSLSVGTPVVCMPFLLDQFYVSEAIERKGLGLCIPSGAVNEKTLFRSINELLKNKCYRHNAKMFQQKLNLLNPFEELSLAINELLNVDVMIKKESTSVSQIIKSFMPVSYLVELDDLVLAVDSNLKFRVANDLDSRKKSYALAYEVYKDRGYAEELQNEMIILPEDATSRSFTLLVEDKKTGRAIATASLLQDSSEGLPCDALFQNTINARRSQKERLVEISRLAIHKDYRNSKMLFVKITNLLQIFARHIWNTTNFVIEVNPRHVKFYERHYLFTAISDIKSCQRVKGHPALLMDLDLKLVRNLTDECSGKSTYEDGKRIPHMYRYFFSLDKEKSIAESLKLNCQLMSEEEKVYFGLTNECPSVKQKNGVSFNAVT